MLAIIKSNVENVIKNQELRSRYSFVVTNKKRYYIGPDNVPISEGHFELMFPIEIKTRMDTGDLINMDSRTQLLKQA